MNIAASRDSFAIKNGIHIKYFDTKVCFLTLLAAGAYISYAQSSIKPRQDTSSKFVQYGLSTQQFQFILRVFGRH